MPGARPVWWRVTIGRRVRLSPARDGERELRAAIGAAIASTAGAAAGAAAAVTAAAAAVTTSSRAVAAAAAAIAATTLTVATASRSIAAPFSSRAIDTSVASRWVPDMGCRACGTVPRTKQYWCDHCLLLRQPRTFV